MVAVYAAGAGWLFLRLLFSHLVARRLARTGFALGSAEWRRALEEWKKKLHVDLPVELVCSSAVGVPVAIGWLRPRILLPPPLLLASGRKHRDSILVHELAHIRRGDYLWQVLAHAALAVYWPHPLAWALVRSIDKSKEEACDDLTVFLLGSPSRYREALVDVARFLARGPHALPGIAMARSSRLKERIRRIESGCSATRAVVSWRLRGALACAERSSSAWRTRRGGPKERTA
jgi:beta-lactamase regulating signal transducer with metallopeptidase domain